MKVTARLIRTARETVFDIDADTRCYGEAAFGSFMLHDERDQVHIFKSSR